MLVLIMSDIHGNLNALKSVLSHAENYNVDAVIIAGDIIDYGMRSNEVISLLKEIKYPVLCNIFGNHENAVINRDFSRFSSERGVISAKRTMLELNEQSLSYLDGLTKCGSAELSIDGKKILCVHGSSSDAFWKSITPDTRDDYSQYDFVISGHSHIPHFFEKYYDCESATYRNKKKTVFINPGSVGQPRNHCPLAQFALIDFNSERLLFEKVAYNIKGEQDAFDGSRDDFYRSRLEFGV